MFDLFRSREKSVRYLLGALLTLVAVSMVITLVPSYGRFGAQQNPSLIAEIGDETLTVQEVRQFIAREMRGNSIPKGMEEFYLPMIVRQMVAERAVAFQASRMGYKVSDAELAELIRAYIPQLFEGGKFAGKDVYAQILAQQNMTIPQFESVVRQEAMKGYLERLALEGVVVTPGEVEQEFKRKNEKIKVAYFGISQDLVKNKVSATAAEVQEFYAKNKSSYQIPQKRSYAIFAIEESKIAEGVKVPEAQLQVAYSQNQERFRTPERVRVRHILLDTRDKSAADVAAIQKKMEDLLKQVKGGADFAELAKKNSDDKSSAVKGGDLEWVTRGQTVPEFEKTAFSLKQGEISGLVKTMYGFHILKLEAREDARLRPLAEVKGELEKELARAQVYDRMQTLADQLRLALIKSTAEAEKFAAANNITVAKAEKTAPGDPLQEVGVNAQFNEAVSNLPKNGVTPVLQIGQNKLVVAQVTEVFPAHQAELADVEKQVRDALLAQKARDMTQEKVKETTAKLASAGGDLAALAKQVGADLKTSELVSREAAITGLGAAVTLDEGYSKNPGEVFGPVVTPNGTFYCKLLEKVPADLTQLAGQRTQMLLELKRRRSSERRELFADGLVDQLIKQKKVKVYEENIKKLIQAYRS